MCAIIGAYLEAPSRQQIDTIQRLFFESRVRGKHATGYSLIQGNKVITRKEPISAEWFIRMHFGDVQPGDYTLQLIGHCRYSTSDLRYNQPIQNSNDLAIVHNGVVTQDPPELWNRYGYDLETSNDSELIWHSVDAGKEPLQEYPNASMSVLELRAGEGMRWYRNGKRPCYMVKVPNGVFIMSTADIAKRAGLSGAKRCKPGVVYTPKGSTTIVKTPELIP